MNLEKLLVGENINHVLVKGQKVQWKQKRREMAELEIRKGEIQAPRGTEISCKGWQQELFLTAGLGSMGRAQPLAITMLGGVGSFLSRNLGGL